MLLTFSAITLLLVSCSPKNEGTILIPVRTGEKINSENYLIPLTRPRFEALETGGRSFVLVAKSPTCKACRLLAPRLEYYINKTKTEVYELDLTSDDYRENQAFYLEKLALEGTPTIYIFKDGTISESLLGIRELTNNQAVIDFFGKRLKRDKLYLKSGTTKINPKKRSATFTYNFNNAEYQALFQTQFYPLLSSNTTVYLEDEITNNTDFTLSFTKYGISFDLANPTTDLNEVVTYFTTYFE